MKRLLALLVVFCLIPLCALGDDTSDNPILGGWYMFLRSKDLPSDPSLENVAQAVMIVTFEENGNITFSELDYNKDGSISTNEPSAVGKWEKDGSDYVSSILTVGKDKMFFENDLLYIMLFNSSTYVGLRKMEPMDVYTNIYRK